MPVWSEGLLWYLGHPMGSDGACHRSWGIPSLLVHPIALGLLSPYPVRRGELGNLGSGAVCSPSV